MSPRRDAMNWFASRGYSLIQNALNERMGIEISQCPCAHFSHAGELVKKNLSWR
ncbi:MAG: hypothetical protein ABSG78_11315 [Verrucomicrobiota bacterium]|jgi:hypothetical protein